MSMVFDKKVGGFNKKESRSVEFTGLEIPREYYTFRRIKNGTIQERVY
jgi:hypothetical protein